MSVGFTLQVTGLKELERSLHRLGSDSFGTPLGPRVLLSALRVSAKPMLRRAKANVVRSRDSANRDNYHIRSALRLMTVKPRYRKHTAELHLGPVRYKDPMTQTIAGGLSKHENAPNYAAIVEEDKPYMAPAFESESQALVYDFADTLRRQIEVFANREAKRNVTTVNRE